MIPFALFEPDKGPFNEGSTDLVMNVTPISNGWAGFPDLSAASDALPSECRGGCYYRTSLGVYSVIAGTATALYRLNTSTVPYSWDDISGPSAPYNLADGDLWQFARFDTGLYATNLGDPLQFLDVDIGGDFADAAGSPPQAKFIAVIGDFLLLGNLKQSGIEKPQMWATSGLNFPAVWTVGSKLADEQFIKDGDEIMGLLGASEGARIIQRHAKRALVLVSDAAMPIKSRVIDPAYGAIAPYSIVQIGGDDYVYLAEDGFQRGDNRTAIGTERVNRYFFATCADVEDVQGVVDPFNHMVWWRYPSVTGGMLMIGWDWEIDRWTQANPDITLLIAAVTAGVTLEGLDAVFLDLYGSSSIDTPGAESLDSRRWKGGRPIFGAIGSDNKLYLFTGSNRAATMDTTAQVLSGNIAQRSGILGAYAVTDTTAYTIAKAGGDKHGDVGTLSFGSDVAPSSRTGIVPLRGDHRIMRFRTKYAAGAEWSYAHGIEPFTTQTGTG